MGKDILSEVWPEWEVLGPIGEGSFGTVYEAVRTDHNVKSRAAVKVIHIPKNKSEIASLRAEGLTVDGTRTYFQGIVDDFVGEIQMMESFKGVQNIVSVEDYKVIEKKDEIAWDIYIRMELLTPFNTYITDRALNEKEVIKLGMDICSALELCEKRNVIHRDIKPENIFVNGFGDFKLGDFGIARSLENVTGGMSQKGTYYYMAPEIEKNQPYDGTVDLYSLGVVLYRLLNKNRLPFMETDSQMASPNARLAAVRKRMDGAVLPKPCDASPAMAEIILRACAYEPGKRFASASAMKTALSKAENNSYVPGGTGVNTDQEKDALNETVSVRKAKRGQDTYAEKQVNTFGEKKKSPLPKVLAGMLAAGLVAGAAFAIVPKLADGDDNSNSGSSTQEENSETEDSGGVAQIEEMEDSKDVDFVATNPVTLSGDVGIATDGSFFLDWGEPKSILMPQPDGTNKVLGEVTNAYLSNKSVSSSLWSLLPYDRDLRFTGTFRQENGRIYLDAIQMTDVNGNEIIVESTQPATSTQQQTSSAQQQTSSAQQQTYSVPQTATYTEPEPAYDPLANWEQNVDDAFYSYVYGFTEAVNTGDTSGLSASTVPNSAISNEQHRIAATFHKDGIIENVLSASVKSRQLLSNTEAAVTSSELIGVNYADGRYEEISQSYTYYMKLQSDGSWRLYKMA